VNRAASDIHTTVAELTQLWPALAGALQRDEGVNTQERVTTSNTEVALPVNADVLATIAALHGEIPATARWACQQLAEPHMDRQPVDHLRHMTRWHDRLNNTNAADSAQQLAHNTRRWLHMTRRAIGLSVPHRPLGQYCPVHDEPLTELVTPGDEGWITGGPTGTTLTWRHTEAVQCPHCGTSWTPGQYLLLGRMLRDADHRRMNIAA